MSVSSNRLYRDTLRLIDDALSLFTEDNFTKGLLVAIPHYGIMTFIMIYMALANIDAIYWGLILFLIGVVIINMLYRGCILIKCERHYFNNREWYGGYEPLRVLGIPLSNKLVAKYYYGWVALITVMIGYRLVIDTDYT